MFKAKRKEEPKYGGGQNAPKIGKRLGVLSPGSTLPGNFAQVACRDIYDNAWKAQHFKYGKIVQ